MIHPWFTETVCSDKVNAHQMMLAEVKKRFHYHGDELADNIKAMIAKMEEGDYIQFYRSPDSTWRQLAGRAGYELMRGDETIVNVLIAMN